MAALPSFPEFEVRDQANLAIRWEKYLKRFNNLLLAMNITAAERKRALLLHYVGEGVNDIFEILPDRGDEKDFKKACEALTKYFTPTKNTSFEIYKFRNMKQEHHETLDDFHTRLQIAAKYCEFGDNHEKEVKAQIELGTSNKKIRRYSFRNPTTNLVDLLAYARTLHETEQQALGIENSSTHTDEVCKVYNHNPHSRNHNTSNQPGQSSQEKKTCYRCGKLWPHRGEPCPAEGQRCKSCLKLNHFASVCRSAQAKGGVNKPVHSVSDVYKNENSSDSDSYVNTVYTISPTKTKHNFYTHIKVGEATVLFHIDSGSTENIIDETTYEHMLKKNPDIKLRPSKRRLFAYATPSPLSVLGEFESTVESKDRITFARIIVVKDGSACLLSGETSIELNLLQVNIPINKITEETTSKLTNLKPLAHDSKVPLRLKPLINEYDETFHGIGKLTNVQVKLHINKDVTPVVQHTRRIPFAMRHRVEAELQRLEKLDIIEPADGATPWVSPIVAFPKPNNPKKIRLCVDMRLPNTAIERERHPQPTIDDLITDLNGACYFSKLDLNSAYHQLELEEDSRYITTFTTHQGLFRYKRLNFGTCSASEVFQNIMQNVLNGIKGCRNISDDIIVHGKTQLEHDTALRNVLDIAKQRNLRFTFDKCQFDQKELEFFGYIFSARGISPSLEKVTAIKEAPIPSSISEVRSFLGMIQYCGRFIPNLATISAPLRLLTRKDSKWVWAEKTKTAFETLKSLLTTDTVMGYFDPAKQTELNVDASPVGLGAILSQTTPGQTDTKIIAFASRSLTDVESRYSQIEREALAIVYGVEHFHFYLYGHPFTLITDHKPLEIIYQNPKSHPSARLERWCLRLQDYNFSIKYRPGPTNPSDYLSRHPLPKMATDNNFVEEYVNFIGTHATPVAINFDDICEATRKDPTLQKLIDLIRNNTWYILDNPEILPKDCDVTELQRFRKLRDELAVTTATDVVLRGDRIIVPKELRQHIINLAHEGHQGLIKTKKLIRESVWFPGIDSSVETTIKKCLACQAVGLPNKPAPLESIEIPQQPWDTIYIDFIGPFPNGSLLLVMIDGRTRYPEVDMVKNTAAQTTIACFERVFATHGLPTTIISDNGPPFTSHDVQQFMKENKINHHKTTPLWPQGNAEAENFMKPLKKCIQTASVENKPLQKELYKFLLNYRTTPHCTTKVPPATALFGRILRNKLPTVTSRPQLDMKKINEEINNADCVAKGKRNLYANNRRGAKRYNLAVGDQVLVKQPKKNKLTPHFDPKPYKVTRITRNMVTACRPGHMITRNCSHFKLFLGGDNSSTLGGDEDSGELEENMATADEHQMEREAMNNNRYPSRSRERPTYYHEEQGTP